MNSIAVNRLDDSRVELVGEIPTERFETYRAAALRQLNQETNLPGFRPGHVPENVLVQKLGQERVLLVMAELALQTFYPEILGERQIDAIGRPEIALTKLAAGNPLGFKITTAISPSFSLPNYRQIATDLNAKKEASKIEVPETEIQELVKQHPNEPREKLEQSLRFFHERRARDRHRLRIAEAILGVTPIALPRILVEAEIDKMLAELKAQIEQTRPPDRPAGLRFEDYLKHLKKEEKDLRADWQEEATKRLKTGLIISGIAKAERLEASAEEVEKETKHLQEHYRGVSPERLRQYVSDLLLVETVWRFLEEQK